MTTIGTKFVSKTLPTARHCRIPPGRRMSIQYSALNARRGVLQTTNTSLQHGVDITDWCDKCVAWLQQNAFRPLLVKLQLSLEAAVVFTSHWFVPGQQLGEKEVLLFKEQLGQLLVLERELAADWASVPDEDL